jgi:hypothetical protein
MIRSFRMPEETETKQANQSESHVIVTAIKNRITEQNSSVRESYIEQEVQVKLTQRVELVKKAMIELSTQKKEVDKIKPDDVKYDLEGKVVQELYSKELIDKRKKSLEKSQKIEKALTKALSEADYTELENILK